MFNLEMIKLLRLSFSSKKSAQLQGERRMDERVCVLMWSNLGNKHNYSRSSAFLLALYLRRSVDPGRLCTMAACTGCHENDDLPDAADTRSLQRVAKAQHVL
jgi:hypothetical protein